MYINLFSAGNRRADFLAEDIRQKGLGDIVYFQSAEIRFPYFSSVKRKNRT